MNNKKELVIITNCTYPVPSATGGIGLKFSAFLSEIYRVRIITLQEGDQTLNGEMVAGAEVYSVSDWRWKYSYIAKERSLKEKGVKKKFNSILSLLMRTTGRIDSLLFHLDNRAFFYKKAIRVLDKLNEKRNVDCIISMSSPIEAHFAVEKFKITHPNVRWVSYWGDLFSGPNYRLNIFCTHEKMREIEKRLLKKSDAVLTTPEVYSIYSDYHVQSNMHSLPYTLKDNILHSDNSMTLGKNEIARFAFMGSLNSKMRNPEFLLRLFSDSSIRGSLDLYSDGCNEMVQHYANESKTRIHSFGKISASELQKQLKKLHILVNIGNSVSTSVPSKVLELMSYRKPILDIYYPGQSSSILSEYPLCLRICMDDNVKESIQRINSFVSRIENDSNVTIEYMLNNFSEYLEFNEKELLINSLIVN